MSNSNKFISKDYLKEVKKKGLFRKGDFTDISSFLKGRGLSKDRNHIRVVLVDQGCTTQEVVDGILEFYVNRKAELALQLQTLNSN